MGRSLSQMLCPGNVVGPNTMRQFLGLNDEAEHNAAVVQATEKGEP
jgi:hypothetical protein